jgi:hypothetical protein
MEALRRIVQLDNLRPMIDIPPTFNYKKVEILILPVEEKIQATEKQVDFDPEKFFGISHIKNIEQAIQEMRDEWN